ncbi:MAG: hypothetical protein QF415_09040 [Candidatus Undinarchaeales archaeon]|jgi:hypothetical protein|nr:hypothetical protein [Candidatus Undinarchaeales archaeon]MDP7493242.1 hypothetical protein [Candidatus Undinarchaeales archaeon]
MRKYKLSKKMLLRRMASDERGAIPLEYLIIATAGLAIAAFVAFQMKRWLCLRSLPQSEQYAVDPAFGCADDIDRAIRQCVARGKGLGRDFTCFTIPMPTSCDDDLFDQGGGDPPNGMAGKIATDGAETLGFQIQTQTEPDNIADDYTNLQDGECHAFDAGGTMGPQCTTLYISFDYTGGRPNIIMGNAAAQRMPSC